MKKSTIILLIVVFFGSVLAVGLFFLKNKPVHPKVYITDVEITDVILSDGTSVQPQKSNVTDYMAVVEYDFSNMPKDGLLIFVTYNVIPADATNKSLSGILSFDRGDESSCKINSTWDEDNNVWIFNNLVVTKPCTVTLTLQANDSASTKPITIRLYIRDK